MQSFIDKNYIPIVLCAGFGSRLKPLTDFIPKVVCPLVDKPFAFYNIEKFFKAGFYTVHCNTHYLSDIVKKELTRACEYFGYDPCRLRFWHEEDILETGGGITRIFKELCAESTENNSKDLIICSGDIVADFPLGQMTSRWEKRSEDELALMCMKNLHQLRKDAAYINDDLTYVLGFGEKFAEDNVSEKMVAKLFTNHQIVSGEIVKKCAIEKKSSIDLFYRNIIKQQKKVINFKYDDSLYWFNVGTPQEYLECVQYFLKAQTGKERLNYSFSMPKLIQDKINLFLQKSSHRLDEIDEGKIGISFHEDKNKQKRYLALNEICENIKNENIIYFYV